MSLDKTDYLHDAEVRSIELQIGDDGERQLRLRVQCDSDCGFDGWNGKVIDVLFCGPIVVLAELFGHMTNAESFNSWNSISSRQMNEKIKNLVDAGIHPPKHVVELVFHSGSVIEVACDDIRFENKGLQRQ